MMEQPDPPEARNTRVPFRRRHSGRSGQPLILVSPELPPVSIVPAPASASASSPPSGSPEAAAPRAAPTEGLELKLMGSIGQLLRGMDFTLPAI